MPEEKLGIPTPEPQKEEKEPETVVAPEVVPAEDLPEEYKGKSVKELVNILEERKKFIGKQSTSIGDLQKDLSYYEQLQQRQDSAMRQVYPQQYPYTPVEEPVQFNFANPVETIEKVVEKRIAERDMQGMVVQQQRVIVSAGASHEEGRKVVGTNPKLFEGIERDVEESIINFYRPYVQQGYDVSQQLRDPKTWETAAMAIRLQRGEVDRLVPKSIKPASFVATETPTAVKSAGFETEPTIEVDDELRKMIKQYGLTEKEAREVILEEAKRKGR